MRQTENSVKIEGILSEIDIKTGSFMKNGKPVESISGEIKVQTEQPINGENTTLEIPIHFFAAKYKNNGDLNPAYENIEKVMTSFSSISAVGIDLADRVRVTVNSDAIRMNEYYNQAGQFVTFPRIYASFVTKITKDQMKPTAQFNCEMMIKAITDEIDRNGDETGRLKITGIIVEYNDKVDVVDFYTSNENVKNSIMNYWKPGDTVKAHGKLNFTSRTETVINADGFGEPVETSRTVSVSELIITGGSQEPMSGAFALDLAEVKNGLAARQARLDALKEKNTVKQKPTPSKNSSIDDLGF